MRRRQFIKRTAAAGAGLWLPKAFAQENSPSLANRRGQFQPASGCTDITNGLVFYYPLAANGTDSTAGNNLTLSGSPSFGGSPAAVTWVAATPTYGYNTAQQWPQSAMSYSTWINMTSSSATYYIGACYSNPAGTVLAAYLQFYTSSSALVFRIHQVHDTIYIGRTTSSVLTSGLHFVCATWDGTVGADTGIKIYLDGTQVDNANADASPASFTGPYAGSDVPFVVGAGFGLGVMTVSAPFDGKQLGTRMYNRALSSSEVTTLYNNGNSCAIY